MPLIYQILILELAVDGLRLLLVILTALFNVWGFAAGLLLVVLAVVTNKTIAGTSYLYPLIPLRWREIKNRFFRPRLSHAYPGEGRGEEEKGEGNGSGRSSC